MSRGSVVEIDCATCGAHLQRRYSTVERVKNVFCNNECRYKKSPPLRSPDIAGATFGPTGREIKVLEYIGHRNGRRRFYSFLCFCGQIGEADSSMIRSGKTQSCGCLKQLKFSSGQGNNKGAKLEAYKNRWDSLFSLALTRPNLKFVMDNIAKEFPIV